MTKRQIIIDINDAYDEPFFSERDLEWLHTNLEDTIKARFGEITVMKVTIKTEAKQ